MFMCDKLGPLHIEGNVWMNKDNNKLQEKQKANLVASRVCVIFTSMSVSDEW